jgi:hypothetical protein
MRSSAPRTPGFPHEFQRQASGLPGSTKPWPARLGKALRLIPLAAACSLSIAAPQRPNFVLIIGDDISVDDFGCYGHPTARTPNVDRLVAGGLRFTNAYLTTSQCSPTRCSVITGRYPHNTGAPELHMPLPEGQVMFPAILREAGYHTAAAGKWHMGDHAKSAFDKVVDSHPGGEERWIECLEKRPKDRPFLMWFAAHDAHRSWQADKDAPPHKPENVVFPPYLIDTPTARIDMAKYHDEVQRLDRYAGLVVAELEAQGVLDNTMHHLHGRQRPPVPPLQDPPLRQRDQDPLRRPLAGRHASSRRRGYPSHCSARSTSPRRFLEARRRAGITALVPGRQHRAAARRPFRRRRSARWCSPSTTGTPSSPTSAWCVAGGYVYIRNAHPHLPQICGLRLPSVPQNELRSARRGRAS